ncbi:MAG: hypothetical protein UHY90_06890 [Treponema sp.]|nr:hypothetical protein [Spirochaetia bacterium]MDD7460333.1 hypothetical protein [Spirochaetales bacterium]MDY5812563.1 hypothetical protein [Treponema sp.]MEE1181965.1 hypothetical protein [Treponema sp.]
MSEPFMTKEQFSSFLPLIVAPVVELISNNCNLSEAECALRFYKSNLYSELSDENTKLWHYSALTLYHMFQDELLSGRCIYPEESA